MKPDRTRPPRIRDFSHLNLPVPTTEKGQNGITIHFIETGTSPCSNVSVVWNYGAMHSSKLSAADFVPEMMLQGTKTMTGEQIVDRLDYYGTFITNSVSASHTKMEWTALNEFMPGIFELMSAIFLDPTFPAEPFEALKRKRLMAFDLGMTQTKTIASRKLKELLAGLGHPYIRPVERHQIAELNITDIENAWADGIHTAPIDIFVTGMLDENIKESTGLFAEKLAEARKPYISTEREPKLPTPFLPEAPTTLKVEMPETKQSSVMIGIPAIPRSHPDYILLRITVVALGGYFGSRLMTSVREELGLTYGIYAYLAGSPEGSAIHIAADCDSSNVDSVLEAINHQMQRLANELMDHDELNRLKSYYTTNLASTLESFKTISDYYETQLTLNLAADYFERQQTEIRTITPERIRQVARQYFKTDLERTVIAGK